MRDRPDSGTRRPYRMRPRPPAAPRTAPAWKRALGKPAVWLVTLLLAATAAYFSDYLKTFFGSLFPVDKAEEASGRPPFEVLDVHYLHLNEAYFLSRPPSEQDLAGWDRRSGPPPAEWLDRQGAVPLGVARWEITLEGRRTAEVVVTDMKPKLVGPCEPALEGSLVETPSQGGGDKFRFGVAVDKPNPVMMTISAGTAPYPYFEQKTIKLPKGEKNVIVVEASTSGPHCRWTIEVDYLADGKRGQTSVTAPGGKPFAVTGRLDPARYSSVFLAALRKCPEPYRRVSGAEYAEIQAGTKPECG
ncbi:hypothetical protein ACFFQW_33415 [Umezawaea endophytica]|uniref:Uncharacterized protein n=1 Tax=Umezawaea endophytica TaxID=1654476 RepID=A0A9X2VPH8_9PSEU|nr:hypothetical protein [Umezawaea endophytica]MCS7480471.1 hypothetical protein [Umezawaea endophytica]